MRKIIYSLQIDGENDFDKVQYPFMIKITEEARNRKMIKT